MQGTPIISITQGVVLCATLRPGSNNAFPSCCVHALQLQPGVATAGACYSHDLDSPLPDGSSSRDSSQGAAAAAAGRGGWDGKSGGSSSQAAAAAGSSSSSKAESSAIGTGAVAQGRIAVATAGGVGPVGLSSNNTVMLSVSDQERLSWSGKVPLVEDTGGRLTVLLTTPTQLVMATESGQVFCSSLMPEEPPSQQQQQEEQQEKQGGQQVAAAAEGSSQGGVLEPVVHVLQTHATGDRFIALDL